MYQVNLFDEVRATLAAVPADARKAFTQFAELLELEPHTASSTAPRTATCGPPIAEGRLLVIWLVLEDQDRVEVVRVMSLPD